MNLTGLWEPRVERKPEVHKPNKECFGIFIAELERIGVSTDFQDYREFKKYDIDETTFSFDGARNSTILYTIENGRIKGWFGKSNSDSGGMFTGAMLRDGRGLKRLTQLHKRFMISGRRKVLRNYKG